MNTRLESLLARIPDDALRSELAHAVQNETQGRKFGLVFEEHEPEAVDLPRKTVTVGDIVRVRDDSDRALWRVERFQNLDGTRHAHLTPLAGDSKSETHPVSDVVAVARHDDPIYPGLTHLGGVGAAPADNPSKPAHVAIQAENYHALKALQFTHTGKVDLIYIDPPYNTGNKDWAYNDRYVDSNDAFRHSKWLSFMQARLDLAKTLLKDTGVIIVAIGDDEHHRLRMLLDQTFGERNFISNVTWQGGRKNDSRYISNGSDYMLIYAKNEAALAARSIRWREAKPGIEDVFAAGTEAWEQSGHDGIEATRLLKAWWKSLPKDHPAQGSKHYNHICERTGRVFFPDNISWPGGGGPRYEVLHPVTGQPVPIPSRGWRYADPETMRQNVEAGLIHFGPDHARGINRKSYLDEIDSQVAESVFYADRRRSGAHLSKVLGDKRFPFPKDHEVLMRWIGMIAPKDGIILDFFAGSGSTGEAVMRLNAADGGTRQCILVTNNEVDAKKAKELTRDGYAPGSNEWDSHGVFHRVTKPRLTTVATGVREDGSRYSDGLAGERVEFFRLDYLDPERVRLAAAYVGIEPLLWFTAGARGHYHTAPAPTHPSSGAGGGTVLDCVSVGNGFIVLHDLNDRRAFAEAVQADPNISHAFIVTDSQAAFQRVAGGLREGVDTHRLYTAYLRSFGINTSVNDDGGFVA